MFPSEVEFSFSETFLKSPRKPAIKIPRIQLPRIIQIVPTLKTKIKRKEITRRIKPKIFFTDFFENF